jgi:hypothetical protein
MSPSTDGIGSTTGLSATARVVEHYAPMASQIARQIASTETCRDEDEVRQKAKELGLLLRAASWRRLSHLFALLIVHAPRARGEVDQ